MQIKVKRNAGLCLLQDGGRWGFRHLGVSISGPMDRSSFRWANWLLGNDANAAVVEITLGQTELEVTQPGQLVVTGADLAATLNGKSLELWSPFTVKEGDELLFTKPMNGLRAYLAVTGGWKAPSTLGSCSTHMRENLGGLCGEGLPLAQGDTLDSVGGDENILRSMPAWLIPDFNADYQYAVIPGFQFSDFAFGEREKLFNLDFKLSKDCDRMGYRLNGSEICASNQSLISEPVLPGAMQVPPDGQPIVLMADCQTLGGYPKLGRVFSLDLDRLSQQLPGKQINFRKISLHEAQNRAENFNLKFET